jgi:hypothetical protein
MRAFGSIVALLMVAIASPSLSAVFDYDAVKDGDPTKLPEHIVNIGGVQVKYRTLGDILITPEGVETKAMSGKLWPNGRFLFAFDAALSPGQVSSFWSASHLWEQGTAVKCVERTSEPGYVIVRAVAGDGKVAGQSVVGYHTTPQVMEIAVWDQYTLTHEIGHALGKAHEHQRSDAKNYLTVHLQNAWDGEGGNLNPITSTRNLGAPMDFDSVMFYWGDAFSKNGELTIELLPLYSQYQNSIGRHTVPSQNDLLDMIKSYGRPNN